jgi:hypothetical protein
MEVKFFRLCSSKANIGGLLDMAEGASDFPISFRTNERSDFVII